MTTFFEHQDLARRNTRILVTLMALGVVAMGCAIYALLAFVEQKGVSRLTSAGALYPPQSFFQPELFLSCLFGTAAVVGLASGSRVLSLRGGGGQIAEMMGGRLVSGSPRDVLEKRLLNVVEEMAIASGVPVPQVFLLEGEEGINAFAAGFTPDDAAVAVTRGCLEKLTRDELQGVIGHEFSHVLNGDMRLNIRLMGIVFGIVCIGLLGRLLMRVGSSSSYTVSSRRDRGSSPGAALFVVGLGVVLIGSVGELFGKLIRAAVSRQREFLADASSVQFTRNPGGIAGALKKIGGFSQGGAMQAVHAEEASHFFFGDIHKRLFDGSVLATHPPLAERIKRIDPSFHGEFPEVGPGIAQPEDVPVSGFASGAGAQRGAATDAASVVSRVGTASAESLEQSKRLLDSVPPALRAAAGSPFSACATVYALLLSDDTKVAVAQRAQIEALAGPYLLAEAERLAPAVAALAGRDRLPLVALLAPALRELSRDQRATFSRTVQALIDADQAVSIFEYVLAQTLKERLSDDNPAYARSRVRYHSLKGVHDELELLLSLLAHAGDFDGSGAGPAFTAGAGRLVGESLTLLPPSTRLLSGLSDALTQLRALAPQLSAQVVDACAHVVLEDRRVTDDEATLVCAVCDALGCPLPPLVQA
jgi:Zn-dependent protease with chaperone function